MGHGNGHGNGQGLSKKTDTKYKNKRIKKEPAVLWSDFLRKFSTEDQKILEEVLTSITGTRKSNRIAESVLHRFAAQLSKYPQASVIEGCRIYLERKCAGEGKDERYLLGIVRQLSKNGFSRNPNSSQTTKTPGQMAIEAAMREKLAEVR